MLDFISTYLFDDNLNKDIVLGDFKFQYLRTDFEKKIALKQLLIFHENLSLREEINELKFLVKFYQSIWETHSNSVIYNLRIKLWKANVST